MVRQGSFRFNGAVMRRGLAVILFMGATAVSAICAPIVLQEATATDSSIFLGDWFASRMIDGDFSTGLLSGWSIYDANDGSTSAATAVFETFADQGFAGGTEFTFTLSQLYTAVVKHTVGRFRISLTTDDRSLFADGLQTGGDVTANWTVLAPLAALGSGGETFSILGDGSVLVSGALPDQSVYTVTASTLLTGITGIRLEVMEDPSLPTNGPGRYPDNGNFVLTEFQVDADQAASGVPEPSTVSLFLAGCAAFGLRRLVSARSK